jgi:hypothetical protein
MKNMIVMVAQCVFVLGSAQAQGDPNLIQNSGFETGSLTAWTAGGPGDVNVVTSYDTLGPNVTPNPTDGGSYFAIMSPDGERDTTLSQNPAIPAGLSQPVVLSFEYDLIAKALHGMEMPTAQDATLDVTIGGLSVFSETYADAGGPALSMMDASGQSGWQTENLTLTPTEFNAIESSGVDLDFSVNESNTNLFVLAAAIDNVELNYTAAPVPDPSSTALLLGGVLSAICIIKRKTG